MRGRWLAGLFLLLIGCNGATPPSAAATSSPGPTPSALPTPSAPPSVIPIAAVDFSCVLPVYGYSGIHTGAFISFPAHTLAPASESGYYYDRAVSRWVPVPRAGVSPDGRRYAYTEGWSASPPTAPRLHIVNAATRTDVRVKKMPDAQPYQVVDFTSTAVYLVQAFEGTAPGVWRFDPATGALAKISNGFYPPAGAAWIGVVDPRDPNPQRSAFAGTAEPNRIDRRDDAGCATTWFYAPGYSVSWVAFTGSPALLVSAFHQDVPTGAYQEAYWLVDGPGHATKLAFQSGQFQSSQPLDLVSGFGSAIADSHGIWIGGLASLYLVRRDGAILRVFDSSLYPANGCF